MPQINLIIKQYDYQQQDYNYLNNEYEPQLPTEEELERAKQYQNKAPDYQLSSGNGNIQAGVILDNPAYSNYEKDLPPAAFASAQINIPLHSNRIISGGGVPNGYGKTWFSM